MTLQKGAKTLITGLARVYSVTLLGWGPRVLPKRLLGAINDSSVSQTVAFFHAKCLRLCLLAPLFILPSNYTNSLSV